MQLCLERGAKDDRPFGELFRRHNGWVWNLCYRFTGHAQDAEDLLQDVFIKTYRSLYQFRGISSFKTWLYQIALNAVRNERRRRARRPQISDTPMETWAESLPAEETVEGSWAAQVRRERLERAWACLRPAEQHVLRLKDLERRPYAEIAALLAVSLSAAKMRVQRARLALQAAYLHQEGAE